MRGASDMISKGGPILASFSAIVGHLIRFPVAGTAYLTVS